MRITLKSSTKEFADQEIEVPDDLVIRDLLEAVQKRFLLTAEYGLATMGPGGRVLLPDLSLAAAGLRTGMIVQMVVTGHRAAPLPPSPSLPPTAEMPAIIPDVQALVPAPPPVQSIPTLVPPAPQPSQPPQPPPPSQPPSTPQTIIESPLPAAPAAESEGMRTMMEIPVAPAEPPKPALSETMQEIPIPPLPPKPANVVNVWTEPAPTDSQTEPPPLSNTLVEAPLPPLDQRREVTKPLSNVPAPGEMYVSKPAISYPPPGTPILTVADPLASLPPSPSYAPPPSTVQQETPPEFAGFGPSVHSALLAEDGQVFRLSQPITIIGRPGKTEHGKVDVDLSVLDPNKSTSRPHARIELRKGQFFVRDLMSSNGVVVNKMRITPAVDCALQDGDKLQLGNVKLTFRIVQAAR